MSNKMDMYKGIPFILSSEDRMVIRSDADLNDIIGSCYEYDTNRLLLRAEDFCKEFFDISSRIAGGILQKLSTYQIRTAIILDEGAHTSTLFSQMVSDVNRMGCIHFFFDFDKALQWLTEE